MPNGDSTNPTNIPNPAPSSQVTPAVGQNSFAKFSTQAPTSIAPAGITPAAQVTPSMPTPVVPPVVTTPSVPQPTQTASSVTVNLTPAPVASPQPIVQEPIKIQLNISTAPPAPIMPASTPPPAKSEKAQEGVVVQTGAPASQAAAPSPATTPAKPTKPDSLIKKLLHWGVFISLMGLGVKGFFDCLYFILVEFQHFEKGLENNFVEPNLISQLILKAALLVFGTALCIFFALQLSLLSKRGNKWLTIFSSMAVFVVSYFVIQYAGGINVVDVFK